jgi:hypothetical protein
VCRAFRPEALVVGDGVRELHTIPGRARRHHLQEDVDAAPRGFLQQPIEQRTFAPGQRRRR